MGSRWGAFRSEALALARQAWLLRHDAGAPVLPSDVGRGEDVVVFLHGLFATAGVLRPLRARVEAHTAALSYAPGRRIASIADSLAELLSNLPRDARLHLVGHSLGGVAARYHAARADDARIVQTISLASPFAGVRGAGALPFAEAIRDLDSDGALMRSIRLFGCESIPHLSIVAADDTVVSAPVSQALPGGEVVVLAGLGHNAMLFDARVAAIVQARVKQAHLTRSAAQLV